VTRKGVRVSYSAELTWLYTHLLVNPWGTIVFASGVPECCISEQRSLDPRIARHTRPLHETHPRWIVLESISNDMDKDQCDKAAHSASKAICVGRLCCPSGKALRNRYG
jgi:hypothetical protein